MSNEVDDLRMLRLLELEFEYLQRNNDKFDNARFQIKSWAGRIPRSGRPAATPRLLWLRYGQAASGPGARRASATDMQTVCRGRSSFRPARPLDYRGRFSWAVVFAQLVNSGAPY
jgi:hypothetical protein